LAQIIKNITKNNDFVTIKGIADKQHMFALKQYAETEPVKKNDNRMIFVPNRRSVPNGDKERFETVFGANGVRKLNTAENSLNRKDEIEFLNDVADDVPPPPTREEIFAEQDKILRKARSEAEKIISDAEKTARETILSAQKEVKDLYSGCEEDCTAMRTEALESGRSDGYELGHSEGLKKGYDEGYDKALNKCKSTLHELLSMINSIKLHKEEYFREYENKLFDTIFTIADKVTVNSLKQKDKSVIQKMLRETAKNFRASEFVKVKLSKIDADEIVDADLETLRAIFRPTQHVEFEILKDGERGTVIVSDDSVEIDASAMTQLKLIENLGKGKFKNK
jgi:flagellar assembly protein FliH